MGRKPKCTVEEKISAVEDYLNGIRSVSEIMIDLSIKSTRTIRNWILAYQNGALSMREHTGPRPSGRETGY